MNVKIIIWWKEEQVRQGRNIVADGRAGAHNPHAYLPLPHAHSLTKKIVTAASYMRAFPLIYLIITNGRTNGWTDEHSIFI